MITSDCQMEVGSHDTQGLYDFRPEAVPVIGGRQFVELVVEDGRRFAFGNTYAEPCSGRLLQDVINPNTIAAGLKFRIVPKNADDFVSVPVFGQTPWRG